MLSSVEVKACGKGPLMARLRTRLSALRRRLDKPLRQASTFVGMSLERAFACLEMSLFLFPRQVNFYCIESSATSKSSILNEDSLMGIFALSITWPSALQCLGRA